MAMWVSRARSGPRRRWVAVEGGEEIGPVGVAVRIGVDVVVGAVGEAGGADLGGVLPASS